jgi:hypothetical protein
MPVTLAELLHLHAARVTRPDPVFDTDQVRWHGASGPRGGWVVMHPEPRDGIQAHVRDPFWTWPVMQIEGDLSHLRLLMDRQLDEVCVASGWQEAANGVHLSYSPGIPVLPKYLVEAIYPLPTGGVLDGFDPISYLKRLASKGDGRGPYGPYVGMSLKFSADDAFELYAFAVCGILPWKATYNPEVLVQDPFLRDLLLTNGPEWISC